MKQDIAKRWVDALRSGKYNQGQNYLRENDNYCCLGVLCELLNIKKEINLENIYYYDDNNIILSQNVVEIVEMKPLSGFHENITIDNKKYDDLIDANDQGVPFTKIADWIEANYEVL